MKGYEAIEYFLGMTKQEFLKHDGEEYELEDGVIHLDYDRVDGAKIARFFTFEELNIIKQAWREQENWHPVDSLLQVIDFSKPYYIQSGVFEFKKGA